MSVRLNSAGATAADPILKGTGANGISNTGLGIEIRIACTSTDLVADKSSVAGRPNLFVGTSANPTGNDQKANLSPNAVDKGTDGAISSGRVLTSATIGSWDADIVAGDWIYLYHASITSGLYSVLTRVTTDLTLGTDYTGGAQTAVRFQIGWRWTTTSATSPLSSGSSGQINYIKAWGEDATANEGSSEENFYIRDAQSDIVQINSGAYTGQTVGTGSITIGFFASWTNKGGAATVAVYDTSLGEGGGNGSVVEITETAIASVTSVTLGAGDGQKNFTVKFRAKSGSASFVTVACNVIKDTSAPTLAIDAVAA